MTPQWNLHILHLAMRWSPPGWLKKGWILLTGPLKPASCVIIRHTMEMMSLVRQKIHTTLRREASSGPLSFSSSCHNLSSLIETGVLCYQPFATKAGSSSQVLLCENSKCFLAHTNNNSVIISREINAGYILWGTGKSLHLEIPIVSTNSPKERDKKQCINAFFFFCQHIFHPMPVNLQKMKQTNKKKQHREDVSTFYSWHLKTRALTKTIHHPWTTPLSCMLCGPKEWARRRSCRRKAQHYQQGAGV